MTRAHISSRIPINNASQVLPDGMLLFPLDGRLTDTMDSVPISSNATTFRTDMYKFMESVAIEDSTTNVLSNPDDFSKWSQHSTTTKHNAVYVPSLNLYGDKITMTGADDPFVYTSYTTTSIASRTFTWSVYAWTDIGQPTELTLFIYAGSATTSIKSATFTLTNVPTRYEVTQTFPSTEADTKITVRVDGINTPTANTYLYAAQGQLEEKDHSTSYTVGTRAISSLQYDITSLMIRDAACISVWIYNSDTMVNNKAASRGGTNNQYAIKLGSTTSDVYKDAVALRFPSDGTKTNRLIQTMFFLSQSTGTYLTSPTSIISLGKGTWNHFVIQWDKNGLPSGNTRELYINGVLDIGDANNASLPANYLTYLTVGDWVGGNALMPCTFFEQMAIHPSKGFTPDVIEGWYKSNAPFFDSRDMFNFV